MSEQDQLARAPLESWQAEQLRVTAFPSPDAQFDASNWWEWLVGEPPETRVSRPKTGGQQEEGQFELGRLVAATEPSRIDWLFVLPDKDHLYRPLLESRDAFIPMMHRWLGERCPAIQRLAFGAVAHLPVDDQGTGYRQLSVYLPALQIDAEHSSDLLYQINRPRHTNTDIADLRINRLTKWFVSRVRGFTLQGLEMRSSIGSESFSCRVEFDINTPAEFDGDLPHERLAQIFQELVDFGMEIVAEGDVP